MKRLLMVAGLTALILTGLGLTSAQAQCVQTLDENGVPTYEGVACFDLIAGQNEVAGTVCVEVVGDCLEVSYATVDDWLLTEAHLWVGGNLADMPQTKNGNPKIGNFPYQWADGAGASACVFQIPLSALGFACPGDDATYYMAAHAALIRTDGTGTIIQSETGWSEGPDLPGGSWAMYSEFTLTCDCPPPGSGDYDYETAFAYGGDGATCFLDLGFSRWGWTNGPLSPGEYTWPLMAGAGQCRGGTVVGSVTVVYDGDTATVTYNVSAPNVLTEVHVYVGTDILPTDNGADTVAPGQYTIATGLDGAPIYVIAHAVVGIPQD